MLATASRNDAVQRQDGLIGIIESNMSATAFRPTATTGSRQDGRFNAAICGAVAIAGRR